MSSSLEPKQPQYRLQVFDVWALGISISAQSLSWNEGYTAGYASYFIVCNVVGLAYLFLIWSIGEVTSMLPFSGGAYGLARCTMGFSVGFIVAMCDAFEYISHCAKAMVSLTSLLEFMSPKIKMYIPILWFVIYLALLAIHIHGGPLFWKMNRVIAVVSLVLTIIWTFGSLPFIDFSVNAPPDTAFMNGAAGFMRAFAPSTWLFVGLEALTTMCGDTPTPSEIIPRGQRYAIVTLYFTGISALVISAGLPPGVRGLPDALASTNGATAAAGLAIPSTLATAFGFIFAYGRILTSLGESNLLSPYFSARFFTNDSPMFALVAGSVVGYLVCSMVYIWPDAARVLQNLCLLFSICSYMCQCWGYIYLKRRFPHLERKQLSPVGIPGAAFAMVVWCLVLASTLFFQDYCFIAGGVFVGVIVLFLVYYHYCGKLKQVFSKQEQKVLFVTHVAIFNNKRSGKKRTSSSGSKTMSIVQMGIDALVGKRSSQRTVYAVDK